MTEPLNNRYEFVLFFDVQDGNPNGDPDAGNLPRIDAETGHGIVTDVCLKRKVRNYMALRKGYSESFDIYVKEKAVLGHAHTKVFEKLGIKLGEEKRCIVTDEYYEKLNTIGLPEGLSVVESTDEEGWNLVVDANADKADLQKWIKDSEELKSDKDLKKVISDLVKSAKPRKPKAEEVQQGRGEMCKDYYDIRTFGAVMSLRSAPNCGQVRGPVQMTFGRSVSPIVALEHSITRMAVATEREAEKQQGDNRTMGRKFTVPYALYRSHGFISPHLAAQTGFSQDDLDLFWESLMNMFDHDRSAARGLMTTRKLIIFKHQSPLGNAPASDLFNLVPNPGLKDQSRPPRSFEDYEAITIEGATPQNVEILIKPK